jgi:hypothetical protein
VVEFGWVDDFFFGLVDGTRRVLVRRAGFAGRLGDRCDRMSVLTLRAGRCDGRLSDDALVEMLTVPPVEAEPDVLWLFPFEPVTGPAPPPLFI